ncbi:MULTISPECIES: hypothetical protein [Pseudomonas]|uniref:hypothetical protein n=1 Tax=Pseudomonas TaxID=286 RepID=UPI001F4915DC|nr:MULTISPECIES: hypothetical protein [Pseudomonas]MDH2002794.1 hypothetical protein [Pseudomonas sp. GD03691]
MKSRSECVEFLSGPKETTPITMAIQRSLGDINQQEDMPNAKYPFDMPFHRLGDPVGRH